MASVAVAINVNLAGTGAESELFEKWQVVASHPHGGSRLISVGVLARDAEVALSGEKTR